MSATERAAAALDAETAVIGSMLRAPELVPRLLAAVNEADFFSDAARDVFRAARRLTLEGVTPDPIAIRSTLGGDAGKYLAECMDLTPSPANWAEYAKILHEDAVLRRIKDCAAKLYEARTMDSCREPAAELQELMTAGQRIEVKTLREMIGEFAARQADATPREYITFGLDALDRGTYVEPGDVVVLGGAPSDGKTALALTFAYHMAQRHNVGFFSLETDFRKVTDRLVSSGFQIDLSRIKRGQMTEEDWNAFAAGCTSADGRRLSVLHASGMTAEQIVGISRAYGFDVIFVDYVQFVEPTGPRGASRAEQMAGVSQTLHSFAQSSRTLVVELAQLTRQERGSKRERDMFDLGESSQFEKDADLILLIYRPPENARLKEGDKSSEVLDREKTRILRVAKNKEGVRGRWPLYFDGAHQSFALLNPSDGALLRDMIERGKWAKQKNRGSSTGEQLRFEDVQPSGEEPF